MASPKFHSTFVDGLLQQGEEKGLEKGLEKGAVNSKIEDLIKVIQARGLELTKAELKLVTSCADLSQLATWFNRALDATTTDEIFGAH
jgi:predicted transposase YdaD